MSSRHFTVDGTLSARTCGLQRRFWDSVAFFPNSETIAIPQVLNSGGLRSFPNLTLPQASDFVSMHPTCTNSFSAGGIC